MNTQTNGSKNYIQKIRQEIFRDINSIWRSIDDLENKSKEALGDLDPMTETLGFAAVLMMNASFDIERHILEGTNKLKPRSVTQLFEILNIIKWSGPKNLTEIRIAYHTGVDKICNQHNREGRTMSDLCVRRLRFTGDGGTDMFLSLVEDWLLKKGDGLCKLIKEHTHENQ